jgi:ankyrin repeat protein
MISRTRKTFYTLLLGVTLVATATTGCFLCAPPRSAYRPIHQYARNGDAISVAACLATNPADLNLPDDAGLTPLHLAAEHCQTNVIVLLLDHGAKINATESDKATPLHLAAQEGCVDGVKILLDRHADVNARDDQKRTPLDRAKQWQHDDIAALLAQHGGQQ